MRKNPTASRPLDQFVLSPFHPSLALQIAGWVVSEEELRWVAPSTRAPLTAAKVAAWKKPSGEAFTLNRAANGEPIGYGEVNPMRADTDHYWLGHIVVRPDKRGRGSGRALVEALLGHVFGKFCAKRVSLVVFPDNVAAIDCYRRVGFKIVAEEFHRFGGTGPAHRLLRLEINPAAAKPRRG